MFITLMFDVHITRFYVIKVRASTVFLRCLVVFKNFTVFGTFQDVGFPVLTQREAKVEIFMI